MDAKSRWGFVDSFFQFPYLSGPGEPKAENPYTSGNIHDRKYSGNDDDKFKKIGGKQSVS